MTWPMLSNCDSVIWCICFYQASLDIDEKKEKGALYIIVDLMLKLQMVKNVKC